MCKVLRAIAARLVLFSLVALSLSYVSTSLFAVGGRVRAVARQLNAAAAALALAAASKTAIAAPFHGSPVSSQATPASRLGCHGTRRQTTEPHVCLSPALPVYRTGRGAMSHLISR